MPEELGFKEQLLMYNFVTKDLKLEAIVIDADDLMKNPREVLQQYCAFVGLQFDDRMLDWSDDGRRTEDKPWDCIPISWIRDVKETTGFRKTDKVHDTGADDYPQIIYDAIEENMQYYDALRTHKLKITDTTNM